jgi:hypothetical protein
VNMTVVPVHGTRLTAMVDNVTATRCVATLGTLEALHTGGTQEEGSAPLIEVTGTRVLVSMETQDVGEVSHLLDRGHLVRMQYRLSHSQQGGTRVAKRHSTST